MKGTRFRYEPSVQKANRTVTCRCVSGGIVCGWMSGQRLTTHSFHGGNWSVSSVPLHIFPVGVDEIAVPLVVLHHATLVQ